MNIEINLPIAASKPSLFWQEKNSSAAYRKSTSMQIFINKIPLILSRSGIPALAFRNKVNNHLDYR